jgi:hypothetical protein
MKKGTGKVSVEQVPTWLVSDEKVKDPTDVANTKNNLKHCSRDKKYKKKSA